MNRMRTRLVLAALLVIGAASLVQDASYASREFRRASAGAWAPRALYGNYTGAMQHALARVPADADVGVFWSHQPFLFNYYLYPRKVFSTRDFLPSDTPFAEEIASERSLRWILGIDLYAASPPADPGDSARTALPGP